MATYRAALKLLGDSQDPAPQLRCKTEEASVSSNVPRVLGNAFSFFRVLLIYARTACE